MEGVAWIAFCNALNHRRNRAQPWLANLDGFIKDEEDQASNGVNEGTVKKRLNPKQITLEWRMKEKIHSRNVSVSCKWSLYIY